MILQKNYKKVTCRFLEKYGRVCLEKSKKWEINE